MRILLIEDNEDDVQAIKLLLRATKQGHELVRANRLVAGLMRLAEGGFEVVLLDLSLPDSQGLETCRKVRAHSPAVPIVVLTGLDDETLALEAVKEGAQDYLPKNELTATVLDRSMRYAAERQRMSAELQALTLKDSLTELYNRRGFFMLAPQQLRLAHRAKRALLLFSVDVDGLKTVNETHGRWEGDQMLVETAKMLTQCFRASDIIARLEADEFAVLAIEPGNAEPGFFVQRLREQVQARNASGKHKATLGLSIGSTAYDPNQQRSVEQLLDQAYAEMVREKRTKRA
jgi:two-component system cell cycle response regulator